MKIVLPPESTVETQPQLQPALLSLSAMISQYFTMRPEFDYQQEHDKPHRPIGNIEHPKNLRDTFCDRPATDEIRYRHFVNIAPLQLSEEIARVHLA